MIEWRNDVGCPDRSRLGLTAFDDGREHAWLDHEDQPVRRHGVE